MPIKRGLSSEGSYFFQSGRGPNSEGGPIFFNPKGSQFRGVLFLPIRGVPIRRGPIFINPEGSFLMNATVGVLSIRRQK